MVYLHPGREEVTIEGVYEPGQTALIMDDLVTGGGSIAETAEKLREAGLLVRDAFVLIDRQQGARERLRAEGINMRSALNLQVILNHLHSNGFIEEEWFKRSMEYLESEQS
jgi:orotate phosphoribosyltransferase/uridine monophosphate synthetase